MIVSKRDAAGTGQKRRSQRGIWRKLDGIYSSDSERLSVQNIIVAPPVNAAQLFMREML